MPARPDPRNPDTASRDNLEADVVFWQQLQRQASVADVLDMAAHHPDVRLLPNTRRLVEIRHNQLRFPLMPPGPQQTSCDAE